MDTNDKKEYLAFISYRHTDIEWAAWLQNKLEFYHLPSFVFEEYPDMPSELRPIFRDVTDLQLGELSDNIRKALLASRYLIVICSTNTPSSKYVNKEISFFLENNDPSFIIPFIVDGVPNSKDKECFPDTLRKAALLMDKEILAANVNEYSRDYAVVKVVSRLLGGLEIHRLWDRYQEAEEKERQRIIEHNRKLRDLSARASTVSARALLAEGNNAIAAKIALLNIPKNGDTLVISEAEYLLRMSSMYEENSFYSIFSIDVDRISSPKKKLKGQFLLLITSFNFWLYDLLECREIYSGEGYFTDGEDRLLFNDDCSLLLSGDGVSFEFFDTTQKIIIARLCLRDHYDEIGVVTKARFYGNTSVIMLTEKGYFIRYDAVINSVQRINKTRIPNVHDFYVKNNLVYLWGLNPVDLKENVDELDELQSLAICTLNLDSSELVYRDYTRQWAVSPSKQFFVSSVFGRLKVINNHFDCLYCYDSLDLGWEGYDLKHEPLDEGVVVLISDRASVVIYNKIYMVGYILHKGDYYYLHMQDFIFSVSGRYGLYSIQDKKLYLIDFDKLEIRPVLVAEMKNKIVRYEVTPDESSILICSDGRCCLFDISSLCMKEEKELYTDMDFFSSSIQDRYIIADKERIRVVDWEGIVKLYIDVHNYNVTLDCSTSDELLDLSRNGVFHFERFGDDDVFYSLYANGNQLMHPQVNDPNVHKIVVFRKKYIEDLDMDDWEEMLEYDLGQPSPAFCNGFIQSGSRVLFNTKRGLILYDLLSYTEVCRPGISINNLLDIRFFYLNTLVAVYPSYILIYSIDTNCILKKDLSYDAYPDIHYDRIYSLLDDSLLISCEKGLIIELVKVSNGVIVNNRLIPRPLTHVPLTLIRGMDGYYCDGVVYDYNGKSLFKCENSVDLYEKFDSFCFIIAPPEKPFIIFWTSYGHGTLNSIRVWSKTGRLIFEHKTCLRMDTIDYDVKKECILAGKYIIPFPPLTSLIADAERKFQDVKLSEETIFDFFVDDSD